MQDTKVLVLSSWSSLVTTAFLKTFRTFQNFWINWNNSDTLKPFIVRIRILLKDALKLWRRTNSGFKLTASSARIFSIFSLIISESLKLFKTHYKVQMQFSFMTIGLSAEHNFQPMSKARQRLRFSQKLRQMARSILLPAPNQVNAKNEQDRVLRAEM